MCCRSVMLLYLLFRYIQDPYLVYSVQYTVLYTLYSEQYTLYSAQYTLNCTPTLYYITY